MAAQGWDLGPQLAACCLRSPSTCRPVRDTVCANFCREYLNTCSSTRKMYQPMISSSAEAAVTAAMVLIVGGRERGFAEVYRSRSPLLGALPQP